MCLLLSAGFIFCYAYTRVDVSERAREIALKRNNHRLSKRSIQENDDEITKEDLLLLQPGESLELTKQLPTSQGILVEKLQETYKGIPVLDGIVTIEINNNGELTGDASGTLIQDIERDIDNNIQRLTKEQALEIAISKEDDDHRRSEIEVQQIQEWIYPSNDSVARVTYFVQYVIDSMPVKRPTMIIDAVSGDILMRYNAIETATCGSSSIYGTGGNVKMGEIEYGKEPYCIEPSQQCFLENRYVRVVSMRHSMKENNFTQETIRFDCDSYPDDAENGASSPALDAFFYGTTVAKMYEEWIGKTPLNDKIVLRVHFGEGFDNAMWNGQNCSFGDGDIDFYPLVSLDVVGHEIGHGVVEQNSRAFYFNQSGGINEAFADIMGISAVAYFNESSIKWKLATDITKDMPFLRSFDDPSSEVNSSSINHVDNFTSDLRPHAASGVFRLAFYTIVAKHNVSFKNAFRAFDRANKLYWHHLSTFQQAGCGVMKSAYDLGQNVEAYRMGFQTVGVGECRMEDHIRSLVAKRFYTGIIITNESNPLFKYEAPAWAVNVTVKIVGASDGVGIIVTNTSNTSSNDSYEIARGETQVEFDVSG